MSLKNNIYNYILRNSGYIVLLAIIYSFTTLIVLIKPLGFPVEEISTSYDLFGPSIAGFILLISISSYLLFRYFTKARPLEEAPFQLIWGSSFLIYSITLLGLIFQAWGFEWADMTNPVCFFVWRTPMIIWVSGMWIGVAKIVLDDEKLVYIPALLILILGESWFLFGLLLLEDIELTMYGFLYWEFVPIALIMAFLWYKYGKGSELSSPNVIALGFVLFAIAYLAWAPWHFEELKHIWYVWFNVYIVSLAFLMTGFYALPKEIEGKLK